MIVLEVEDKKDLISLLSFLMLLVVVDMAVAFGRAAVIRSCSFKVLSKRASLESTGCLGRRNMSGFSTMAGNFIF